LYNSARLLVYNSYFYLRREAPAQTGRQAILKKTLSHHQKKLPVKLLREDERLKIRKAVITAAAPGQRSIPLQTLIAQDGSQKSVLAILIDEVSGAGIEDVCVVTSPGDERRYTEAIGNHACRLQFIPQPEPHGYGHALCCARDFAAGEPVLHLVGDHLYIGSPAQSCAKAIVSLAGAESCSVSAVQSTRESLLPSFGTIGGRRVPGKAGVYTVDRVIEKPTPTEAEQKLQSPGVRAGHYLCFFGMHVLTPAVMNILGRQLAETIDPRQVTLSSALDELKRHEQYLALENSQRRYDIGSRYGLMLAQMALALRGHDRDEILYQVLELVADREVARGDGK
jgi:UTP--glucose-1-phosphate uridylyltransferase